MIAMRPAYYYAPPTQAQWAHSLDQFAELLSLDTPLPAIADAMHVTRGTVTVLLRMLREEFGEQSA